MKLKKKTTKHTNKMRKVLAFRNQAMVINKTNKKKVDASKWSTHNEEDD